MTSDQSISEQKTRWRSLLQSQLQTQGVREKAVFKSNQILKRVIPFLNQQSGIWALYRPLKDEPQLLELANRVNHITWVYPKVVEGQKKNGMDNSRSQRFSKKRFGNGRANS